MPRWYYNLAIGGCSYSQGEFSHVDEEYKITHRGLSYYLESNNYQTINVGQNGLSNRGAIKNLTSLRDMNILHWLLIKTDPVRDLLTKNLRFTKNFKTGSTHIAAWNIKKYYTRFLVCYYAVTYCN